MRAAVLAPVIVAALCLSTSHAVPSVSRHRRGDGKGQASVVLRPDDMTDRSAPLLGAKIDPKIDKLTSKQGRELRDIKSPEDIRKFAHVLHGLEELFKNSDIKKDLGLRLTSSRTSPEDFETNDVDEKIRKRYDPTWESLDTRPLPNWYDEAKFGIFIHWGVYSVPSVGTEWFWWNWQGAGRPSYQEYMSQNFKPNFTYADFAPQFTAEFFNASEWATLIQSSGAKYVVLTSKHHEGFTNWPSPYSFNWNSVDVGPHKDLVGELANAVRTETDVRFGLYYSLFEWFNPLYLKDKNASFQSRDYVVNKMTPELKSLIETYKPEIVWSDGDWEAQYTYWDSPGFLAWLYNDSPVRDSVVVNDRWGSEMACNHGGYYTCSDRYNPGTLQPHKWENCWTIDKQSWGYRRNAHIWEYCSIEELVQVLAETVACGGNLLLNVGPAHDGSIKPIFEERLLQMGAWLKINDEAIYKSNPWIHQNDTVVPGVWYTMRKFDDGSEKVYGIVLNWPASGKLVLGAPKFCSNTVVNLLGWPDALPWTASTEGPEIVFPPRQSVVSDWGWVLAFQGLCNE